MKKMQDTSLEAYAEATKEPKKGEWLEKILKFLEERGIEGATDEEMDISFGTGASRTNRPHRLSLVKQGSVVNSGKRRPTRSGRSAIVWVVSAHGEEPGHWLSAEQNPDNRATIEQAVGLAALARESLSGKRQKLVWFVDLRKDVGEPDAIGDIDGYHDMRWTDTLSRLKETIRAMEDDPDTVTDFGMIVVCMVGRDEGETPTPVAVELSIPHKVNIGKLMSNQPPMGRWRLMGEGEFSEATKNRSTPSSYFIDGIPF